MNDTTFQGDGKVAYVPVVVNTKLTKHTNGDRIRVMTDEELAEVISGLGDCDTCYLYHRRCSLNTSCKDAVLEWLRKGADLKTIRKTEENADTFQQN